MARKRYESQTSAESAVNDSGRSSYNTIRRSPKPAVSYSTRITLTVALTAIMTAVIMGGVMLGLWQEQFSNYTRDNLQRMAQQLSDTISQQYESTGGWTDELNSYIEASSSSMTDVGVQVLDADGISRFEDASPSGNASTQGRTEAASTEENTVTADIKDGMGRTVGQVRLWALGADALLTRSDVAFRRNFYSGMVGAAIVAVILAWVLGYFVSRSLTRPLTRITSTAAQIRNGDLSARTGVSGSDEMGHLGETFDDMATTLEKDIKLEHRLTSDVAHELRTPLMAMQATVEAMQDGVLPADQEHLATVAIEVRRLSRLVDAMLKLSRMENGKTPLHIERCDVVGLASGLVTYQSQLFKDNGLELTFENDTGHEAYFIEADPDLIREAIVNLLSNAMRYTPEGGKVRLTVARKRSDVLISVSDTGIGIAKEDIPRVFSRFWRSDASRERVAGGLGVGLSLTKEIIDRHNGTISVDSELGVGTTFTLHLPVTHAKKQRSRTGKLS